MKRIFRLCAHYDEGSYLVETVMDGDRQIEKWDYCGESGRYIHARNNYADDGTFRGTTTLSYKLTDETLIRQIATIPEAMQVYFTNVNALERGKNFIFDTVNPRPDMRTQEPVELLSPLRPKRPGRTA